MTATHALAGVGAAVVVFWIVGAYNRMVRLRSTLVGRFAAVDAQYRERQTLLEAQHAMLTDTLAGAAPRLEALRAACGQAEAAREKARLRPGAASTITSLRVAEEILADARSRLPVQGVAGEALPELNERLAGCDTALAFARREFNDAVAAYNAAVAQFPTMFVAWLFSFRAAALF